MRILAVVGSIRRGNTYAMVEAACHALNESDIELIHLKDLDFKMCDGCLSCDESGLCTYDDDMSRLLDDVKKADGFIFGTPARWSLLSGELKVFFDRLNPLAVPELLKGKKAIIFAVGQTEGEEAESITIAADSVKAFCDNAGIEVVDTVIAKNCLEADSLITNNLVILDKCRNSAINLYKSLLVDK